VTTTPINPNSTLSAGNGLRGQYYSDKHLIQLRMTRVDPTINFNWNRSGPPSLPHDRFSIRWTGFVVPVYTEAYTFYTASDDGARLWVDTKQLVNQWVDQPLTEKKGTIALIAGRRYPIRIDYYEHTGDAYMSLRWSSPSQPKQVIPQSQLFAE
jgi:hypothetical protein